LLKVDVYNKEALDAIDTGTIIGNKNPTVVPIRAPITPYVVFHPILADTVFSFLSYAVVGTTPKIPPVIPDIKTP
jgi:hypothetical protein